MHKLKICRLDFLRFDFSGDAIASVRMLKIEAAVTVSLREIVGKSSGTRQGMEILERIDRSEETVAL